VKCVDNHAEATCNHCRSLAVGGTLDRLEIKRLQKQDPATVNRRGKPRYTDMQKAFAAHPQVTTNAKQAALDVGYSASYAKTQSHALREQVAPLIMEIQEAAKRRTALSVAKVQTELASMGFANVVDYFNIGEDGSVEPKQLNELTREQAAAIQEVKVTEIEDPETGRVRYVIGYLKLADKRANLVELGKTLGMFTRVPLEDKSEAKLLTADVPTEALEAAEAMLLQAAATAKDKRKNAEAIPGEFEKLSPPEEK
jgi:phage terminase small subunit